MQVYAGRQFKYRLPPHMASLKRYLRAAGFASAECSYFRFSPTNFTGDLLSVSAKAAEIKIYDAARIAFRRQGEMPGG